MPKIIVMCFNILMGWIGIVYLFTTIYVLARVKKILRYEYDEVFRPADEDWDPISKDVRRLYSTTNWMFYLGSFIIFIVYVIAGAITSFNLSKLGIQFLIMSIIALALRILIGGIKASKTETHVVEAEL